MVRVTITDCTGDIFLIMEYARESRLDRRIMRSIERAVDDITIPDSDYIPPLNIYIITDV